MRLPSHPNQGRLVALALKFLWRRFGIRCTAIKDPNGAK
jgi:hypothetical protein